MVANRGTIRTVAGAAFRLDSADRSHREQRWQSPARHPHAGQCGSSPGLVRTGRLHVTCAAYDSLGEWLEGLSGYGNTDYVWFSGQNSRTLSVEVTALHESRVASQ